MFGLGRRKDHEIRRLQEWSDQLEKQLQQAQHELLEAKQRAESAETRATSLAAMNRALAAKTHRLELQRHGLEGDKERIMKENKELQIANLQAENEARMAKAANTDAWEVTNLKLALRRQAVQHETKMESLKRRTKALLSTVLPAGHGRRGVALGSRSAPGSPTAASPAADLWDAPLYAPPVLDAEPPDVNAQIRQIITWLYDDTISEDQALEQMTTLTQDLAQPTRPQPQMQAESRGCSPLPALRFSAGAADDSVGGAEMVDAGTDPQTARPQRLVADVATETPAELSYVGSPRDTAAATPSASGTPARRLGGPAVPALDLAALVAQAMEAAPLSGRSTASTTAAGNYAPASSFNAFSHFVLAQPEKLQRLIMRHAAATGAISKQQAGSQSPMPPGLAASAASAAVGAGAATDYASATGPSIPSNLDSTLLPPGGSSGSFTARPSLSLAGRLLGLGTSSNVNRAAAPAPPPQAPTVANNTAAGVVMPSGAGPAAAAGGGADAPKPALAAAPAKRSAAPPKFAGAPVQAVQLQPVAAAAAPAGLSFPQLLMPALPSVKPVSPELRGLGAGGFTGRGALEADADFKELFGGEAAGALALGRTGGVAR